MAGTPDGRFSVDRDADRVAISFDDGGMNLLSREALEEMRALLAALRKDSVSETQPVRMITFRSLRPNLFAAGADMKEMSAFSGFDAEGLARLGQEVFAALEQMPSITVALIDGDCFGGALDFAMAFDLRLATARSRFSHPGARLGIVTGYGGTSRWRKLLDASGARALFLGNAVLDAPVALEMGLVDRIADDFEPDLTRLAQLDPASVRLVNELTSRAHRLTQRELALLTDRLGNVYAARGIARFS